MHVAHALGVRRTRPASGDAVARRRHPLRVAEQRQAFTARCRWRDRGDRPVTPRRRRHRDRSQCHGQAVPIASRVLSDRRPCILGPEIEPTKARRIPEHRGRMIRASIRKPRQTRTQLWEAWADPAKLGHWFPDRAEGRIDEGAIQTVVLRSLQLRVAVRGSLLRSRRAPRLHRSSRRAASLLPGDRDSAPSRRPRSPHELRLSRQGWLGRRVRRHCVWLADGAGDAEAYAEHISAAGECSSSRCAPPIRVRDLLPFTGRRSSRRWLTREGALAAPATGLRSCCRTAARQRRVLAVPAGKSALVERDRWRPRAQGIRHGPRPPRHLHPWQLLESHAGESRRSRAGLRRRTRQARGNPGVHYRSVSQHVGTK